MKAGIFNKELSGIFHKAFDLRQKGDYEKASVITKGSKTLTQNIMIAPQSMCLKKAAEISNSEGKLAGQTYAAKFCTPNSPRGY